MALSDWLVKALVWNIVGILIIKIVTYKGLIYEIAVILSPYTIGFCSGNIESYVF